MKMKKFKCPNCHREVEVNGDIISALCGCGYSMVEQNPTAEKLVEDLEKWNQKLSQKN